MLRILDETDVPLVAPTDLARAMRFMIDSGRGLVLLRGVSAMDMRDLEAAIWDCLDGDVMQRRAVLVRFQCLVDVFSARRLRDLMMRRGFRVIAPALQLAAETRLNSRWGFNPHRFNLALHARMAEAEQRRPDTVDHGLDLAA